MKEETWDYIPIHFDYYDSPDQEIDSNLVYLSGCIGISETDKALLILFPNGEGEWIPKNQIFSFKEGVLVISKWLANKRYWI